MSSVNIEPTTRVSRLLDLGVAISNARKQRKLSQSAVATQIEVSRRTVSAIECGTADNVSFQTVMKAAWAVGLEMSVSVHRKPNIHEVFARRAADMEKADQIRRSGQGVSAMLGLDFPYDWSNPNMDSRTLIQLILLRNRFEDVAKVASHFGLAEVEAVAELSQLRGRADVARTLENIKKGFERASPHANE